MISIYSKSVPQFDLEGPQNLSRLRRLNLMYSTKLAKANASREELHSRAGMNSKSFRHSDGLLERAAKIIEMYIWRNTKFEILSASCNVKVACVLPKRVSLVYRIIVLPIGCDTHIYL